MQLKTTIAIAATLGAEAVLAHGLVKGVTIDGKFNQGYILDYYYKKQSTGSFPNVPGWYAENLDNGFVEPASYANADIICHKKAEPGQATATVAAGGNIEFDWDTWPESHIGPIITYAAPCGGDCTKVDKTALKWFKIEETGYDTATKSWKTSDMIKNGFKWSTKVPANLKADNYVFRHEIIALHSANQQNGAQNYPQCVNVKVTGSGTEQPAGVVGTSLYKADDAGILFNPYGTISSYQIPGPAMPSAFKSGGSGSGSGSTQPPTPTTSPVQSTPAATATPSATPTATPTNPGNGSGSGSGSGAELPQTFTLDTFIAWLKQTAGRNARRSHPRQLMN